MNKTLDSVLFILEVCVKAPQTSFIPSEKSQFIEMFGTAQHNEKGWTLMSMKDASIRLSDGPFGSNLKSEHYRPEGVRVIRLQNICDGYFLDDDKAYVGLDHNEKIKKNNMALPGIR